jgi:hypothetical protein
MHHFESSQKKKIVLISLFHMALCKNCIGIAKVVSLLANLRFPNENEEQTFVKGNPRNTPTN